GSKRLSLAVQQRCRRCQTVHGVATRCAPSLAPSRPPHCAQPKRTRAPTMHAPCRANASGNSSAVSAARGVLAVSQHLAGGLAFAARSVAAGWLGVGAAERLPNWLALRANPR